MLLFGFIIANIITVIFLLKKGYKLNTLYKMMIAGIIECKVIFAIILLMGATISVWLSSGIVPGLIYYGFDYLKGVNFVLAAFLSTMLVSFIMGTAIGTLSTVGIAFLGIGAGLNIPAPILLGAIVSGSFVADKVAPISSLTNLTIQMTGVKYRDYLKSSLFTLIPTVMLSSFVYILAGMKYSCSIDTNVITEYQSTIYEAFVVTPFFILFPVLFVILAFTGFNIVYNMSIGVIAASLITIFVQRSTLPGLIKAIMWGFKAQTGISSLDELVSGGGIIPLVEVLFIVLGSVTLSSLFQGTQLLKPVTKALYKESDGKLSLIAKTGLLSILFVTITFDQTVGIIIPANIASRRFDRFGLKRSLLARTISDTGTIIAPLQPWNVNSIIIHGVTGISALSYAPYAVLCFISPIIALISGMISLDKIKTDKEQQNMKLEA